MGIKNWVVKGKGIKNKATGLRKRINYLMSENAPSHNATTIIPLIKNVFKHEANMINEINQEAAKRKCEGGARKGMSAYAQEFSFNLPSNIKQPTRDQWWEIYKILINDLTVQLNQERIIETINGKKKTVGWKKVKNFNKNELHKITIPIIHNENDGKPNHLNIIVGKVLNGNKLLELQRRSAICALKNSFNKAVLEVLELDHKDYVPLRENVGNVPIWEAREELEKERISKTFEKEKNLFNDFMKSCFKFANNFKDKKMIQKTLEAKEAMEYAKSMEQNEENIKNIKEMAKQVDEVTGDNILTNEAKKLKPKEKTKQRRRRN